MKVVAFNGSPRANGNTDALLRHVLEEIASDGIDTEVVHAAAGPVRGCTACFKCFGSKDRRCAIVDDPVNEWIAKMDAADGILIGSPTYFADVTAETKALIDRAGMVSRANGGMLRRKAGAAVVAVRRAGGLHAFDSINHFFLIGEMVVPGSSYWNIGCGREPGAVETDAEGIETMTTLGRNMAWLLKALSGARPKG